MPIPERKKSPLFPTLALFLLTLSLWAGPATANHEWGPPDLLQPGDPRYLQDILECTDNRPVNSNTDCVAFYPHFFSFASIGMLTTQRPPDCAEGRLDSNYVTPNIEPLWDFSRMEFDFVPGYPGYESHDCHISSSAGAGLLNQDLVLDPMIPIVGYWYLAANATTSPGFLGLETGTGEGLMPCVTVRMALETGRRHSSSVGTPVAQGETTKTVVTADLPAGAPLPDPCPGSEGTIEAEEITEFRVALSQPEAVIPKLEMFNLKVQWYHHEGASNNPDHEDNLGTSRGGVYIHPDAPNRIILPVETSMDIAPLTIEHDDGVFTLETQIFNSIGAHNLDLHSIQLKIHDENGDALHTGPPRQEPPWPRWYTYDGNHFNYTALWNVASQHFEPGDYTATVTAMDWRHTASVQQTTAFTLGEEMQVYLAHKNETPPNTGSGKAHPDLVPYLLILVTTTVVATVLATAYRNRGKW